MRKRRRRFVREELASSCHTYRHPHRAVGDSSSDTEGVRDNQGARRWEREFFRRLMQAVEDYQNPGNNIASFGD